ncbi:MAG: VWA domain-containing protein [Acidobacteria bacterium]|nr:VWA domain-containing protein [Acidobacteriota bacterium]
MRLRIMLPAVFLLVAVVILGPSFAAPTATPTSGSLSILGASGGFCPLRHTDVKAGISGLVARVTVTQSFENPSPTAIEAVYTFPLPHDAALDDMTIRLGSRTIRGVIKTREEAARIYAQAVKNGQTAARLDQERPNIFTQTVGNIPPGVDIDVTISYVQRLTYDDGEYEFTFPMVVGPRYVPGNQAIGHSGGGFSPDTDRVPDASKVTPPVSSGRAGHDISLAVSLDAGIPIKDVASPSHKIDVERTGVSSAIAKLDNDRTIPNRDFILRYKAASADVAEGLLTHAGSGSAGYFSLIVQPPERFPQSDVTPKELVFVLDSSGSMNGFPETKAKQFIDTALNGLYPGDTFNVIKFSGETAVLFPEPVYPAAINVEKARQFVDGEWGGGGTEMMKAIKAALDPSDNEDHVRIVVFLTDGYVGNDFEILSEIRKHPNARVFAYGIGSSVNRFLVAGMGRAGRGESEVISEQVNPEEADQAARRLYEHLRSPLLTDVRLDFGALPVTDVYPRQIPDLYGGKPIIVTGRYTGSRKGTVRLVAKRAGDPYTREIPVAFPAVNADNPVLQNLWARYKIENLLSEDWGGADERRMNPRLQGEITKLGLEYGLVTEFTSLVAVEEQVSNVEGKPTRIQVPVELPRGVEMEQGWGASQGQSMVVTRRQVASIPITGRNFYQLQNLRAAPPPPPPANGTSGGSGGGIGRGPGAGAPHSTDRAAAGSRVPETKLSREMPNLALKLSPHLLADYQCWRNLSDKSAAGSCHVKDGKLTVEIIVTDEASAASLSRAGFEPEGRQTARHGLRGKIAPDRLPDLAKVEGVQLIAQAE